jgi:hypothetical protein
MSEYNLGDTVYVASFNAHREKTVPCRMCVGTGKVLVVNVNGDQFVLECDFCGKGRDVPSGREVIYEAEARVSECVVTEKTVKVTAAGQTIGYNWPIGEKNTYATEAEAQARAEELAAEAKREEEERCGRVAEHTNKSYAWAAGYHLREIDRLTSSLAYHKRMVKIAAEKASPSQVARILKALPSWISREPLTDPA